MAATPTELTPSQAVARPDASPSSLKKQRPVSPRRAEHLARKEAAKTPEQKQKDLRRQEARYAVDQAVDKRKAERKWFNPKKYLVGMTEAAVKWTLAHRVTKAMEKNGINIATEDFVREASKMALRRIINSGEREKLQNAAQEAGSISAARLKLQSFAEGGSSTAMERMTPDQVAQLSELTGDIYKSIISEYLESHTTIPQEKGRQGRLPLPTDAEVAAAQQKLAEIASRNPGATDLNSTEMARAMLLLARELRTAGITSADSAKGTKLMEGKLFSTGPVAEMDKIYRERLIMMGAQWGKNIAFGAAGIAMANPATMIPYLGLTFGAYMIMNYRKLSLERTVRTIDAARGTLKPTPDHGGLGKLWGVDWNKLQADGTLGTRKDMFAAVLTRSAVGTASGAAFFFLGHSPIGEGIGNLLGKAKDVVGNGLGKAGEGIGHVAAKAGEAAAQTTPGKGTEAFLGNTGNTIGSGLGATGSAKDALLHLAGVQTADAHAATADTVHGVGAADHATNATTDTSNADVAVGQTTDMHSSGVVDPNSISRVSDMEVLRGSPIMSPAQIKEIQQYFIDHPPKGPVTQDDLDKAMRNALNMDGSKPHSIADFVKQIEQQAAANGKAGNTSGLTPQQIMDHLRQGGAVTQPGVPHTEELGRAAAHLTNDQATSTSVLHNTPIISRPDESIQATLRIDPLNPHSNLGGGIHVTDQPPAAPDIHSGGGGVDYGQTAGDLAQLKGITPPSGDSFVFDAAHHSVNLVDAHGNIIATDVHFDSSHNIDMILANGQHVEVPYTPGAEGTLDQFVQHNKIEFSNDTRNWQDLHAYVKGDGIVFKYEPHVMPNGVQAIGFMDHTGHAFYIPNNTLVSNDSHMIPLLDSHGNQIGEIRSSDLYHELGLTPDKVAAFAKISQERLSLGAGHTQYAVDNYPKYFPGQSLLTMRAIGGSWDHGVFVAGASNHSFSGNFDLQNAHVGGGYDFEHPIPPGEAGGAENIFQQAMDFARQNPAQAALVGATFVGLNYAMNIGVNHARNRDFGFFNPNPGDRRSLFAHLAVVGGIEAVMFTLNPGAAIFAGAMYLAPYIARGVWEGGARVVTGGRYGASPAAAPAPAQQPQPGNAPAVAQQAGTNNPATTPPGNTNPRPPGVQTPPPANAYPNFVGTPVGNAARNLANPAQPMNAAQYNQAVNNLATQLAPNNPGVAQPVMQRQVNAAVVAARNAYNANRTPMLGATGGWSVSPEAAAASLVEGNPLTGLDLTNDMNARAMAEIIMPGYDETIINYAADAIRRAAIARQEFEAILPTQRNDRAELQAAATRALDRINAEVDNRLDPAARARGVAMQAIGLRNMFMTRAPALLATNTRVEGALNSAFASQTGMTPELRAVAAAAVHPTHMQYTQAQFNVIPYDDPHAPMDQRRIYEQRAAAAMQAARLRFGASPSNRGTIDTVLTTLNDTYQDISYLGTSEDQRFRAIDEAVVARGGTFEQRIQAVVAMSPDAVHQAQNAAELATNNVEIFETARVLQSEGLDGDIIRQGLEDSIANRGGAITPAVRATIEAILDQSATPEERLQRGIRELGNPPAPIDLGAAISYIYAHAGIQGIDPDIVRNALQIPEVQGLTFAARQQVAETAYDTLPIAHITPQDQARVALAALGIPPYNTGQPYMVDQIRALNLGVRAIDHRAHLAGRGVDFRALLEQDQGFTIDAKRAFALQVGTDSQATTPNIVDVLGDALELVISPTTSPEDINDLLTIVKTIPGLSAVRSAADIDTVITTLRIPATDLERRALIFGGLIEGQPGSAALETLTHMGITRATPTIDMVHVAQGLTRVVPTDTRQVRLAFARINGRRAATVAPAVFNAAPGTAVEKGRLAVMISGVTPARAQDVARALLSVRIGGRRVVDTSILRESMQTAGFQIGDQETIVDGVLSGLGLAVGSSQREVDNAVARALAFAGVASRADLRAAHHLRRMRTQIETTLTTAGVHAGIIHTALDNFS